MSLDLSHLDWLATCPHCKAKLTERHAPTCKHWGQVLPSECPGYIESVLLVMLESQPARAEGGASAPRTEAEE